MKHCDAAGKMNLSLFYVFKSKIVDVINRANVETTTATIKSQLN